MLFNAKDSIRGNQGTAFATLNGQVKELFYLSKFEFNAEIADHPIDAVGTIITQHKKGMINLTGNIELYDVTSDFVDLLIEYKKTRIFPYFSVQGTNDDPESSAGIRSVKFTDVSFNNIPLSLLDIGAGVLKATMAVVANDFEVLEKFSL